MNVIGEKKHPNNGCEPFGSAIHYAFYIGDGFIVNINETYVTSTIWQNLTVLLFHSTHIVLKFTVQYNMSQI